MGYLLFIKRIVMILCEGLVFYPIYTRVWVYTQKANFSISFPDNYHTSTCCDVFPSSIFSIGRIYNLMLFLH